MSNLYTHELLGNHGRFKVSIDVEATKLPDLNQESIRAAAYAAAELIESAVMAAVIAANPADQTRADNERKELLSCFDEGCFVKEIPNGYCSRWCCKHLPWFEVTTKVGPITIGWRKRVIQIDWSQTVATKTADELFAAEDTTKENKLIHAWSVAKAKEYINSIISTAHLASARVV